MELMTAKMARFAPRQIAIVASAVSVKAGALRSWRKAKRRLFIEFFVARPSWLWGQRASCPLRRMRQARCLCYGQMDRLLRISFSFGAQCCDGIGFGGAHGGQERGEKTDNRKDKHDAAENQRIIGRSAEEQCLHEARHAGRGQQSKHETERRETRTLAHHEPQNVAHLRTERETNSEFTRP